MKLIDSSHPFYRPLWRRVAICTLTGGWSLFEFLAGSPFWGMLLAGVTGLCVWSFFIDFEPEK